MKTINIGGVDLTYEEYGMLLIIHYWFSDISKEDLVCEAQRRYKDSYEVSIIRSILQKMEDNKVDHITI